MLLYTSGTTGKPKGARITHANLAAQTAALRLEGDVDRLERHARVLRDRGHRRGGVALPLEERLRRLEDLQTRRGRLGRPAGGVVATRALDGTGYFATLPENSLLY